MIKFISVPLAAVADSGTASATTANKLVEAGQNFVTTVAIGDVIVNTTDNTTATVTAIDSNTTLSISADIMANLETYVIYSATVKVDQIIQVTGAILVQQATASTTTIAFGSASTGTDVLTITHSPLVAGSVTMRTAVQNAITEAFNVNSKPRVVFPIVLPSAAVSVISTAIA